MKKTKFFIPDRTFFRIGDVGEILGVKPYVIRFWETEFPFVAPDKARSGQRVYRRPQVEGLILIKHLLHGERYSIEGAKKKLTDLRKTAKLKEAMHELVSDEAISASNLETFEEAHVLVQVGSVVPKDKIAALQEKVTALQTLIREPKVNGKVVPGLKKVLVP